MIRFSGMMRREPWWCEFWSAAAALTWAVWVLMQPDRLGSLLLYHVVTDVASDTTWVLFALLIGGFQMIAVFVNHKRNRFAAAFFAGSFWLCLAYGLWLGNPSAPGAALHLIMGALNMASMVFLSIYPHTNAP